MFLLMFYFLKWSYYTWIAFIWFTINFFLYLIAKYYKENTIFNMWNTKKCNYNKKGAFLFKINLLIYFKNKK